MNATAPASPLLPLLSLFAQALAWRFFPQHAWWVAGINVGCVLAFCKQGVHPSVLWLAPAVAALIAPLSVFPSLWPCQTACQGGAAYGRLLGFPNQWLGLFGYSVLAGLLAWPRSRRLALPLAWAALGGSAYFVMVLIALGVACPACLTNHGIILWLLPALFQQPRPRAYWAVPLCALALHAAFHPQLNRAQPAAVQPGVDFDLSERAARGRSYGRADAPVTVDLILRTECRHCAEELDPLVRAALPAVDRGEALIRFLIRYDAANPASSERAQLLQAAAIEGLYVPVLKRLLDSEQVNSSAGNHARLEDLPEAAAILARLHNQPEALATLAAHDATRAAPGPAATPVIIIHRPQLPVLSLSGEHLPAQLALALNPAP